MKPITAIPGMVKKYYLVFLFAIAALTLDQVTKNVVLAKMQPHESIPVIQSIFHLTYAQNTGTAFSFIQDVNLILILISSCIILGILYTLPKVPAKEKFTHIALGLLLGGAMGNLLDRIFLGFVVDFLDFRIWPIFNAADSAISISLVMLVILYWNK